LIDRGIVIILNKKEKITEDMNKKLASEKVYIVTSNFMNDLESSMNEGVFESKDLTQEYIDEQDSEDFDYNIEEIPLISKKETCFK